MLPLMMKKRIAAEVEEEQKLNRNGTNCLTRLISYMKTNEG